jgi:hypothetical protein
MPTPSRGKPPPRTGGVRSDQPPRNLLDLLDRQLARMSPDGWRWSQTLQLAALLTVLGSILGSCLYLARASAAGYLPPLAITATAAAVGVSARHARRRTPRVRAPTAERPVHPVLADRPDGPQLDPVRNSTPLPRPEGASSRR